MTASAAGETAILQTVPVAAAGAYMVTVSGAAGTAGQYTLEITLNAAQELETGGGPANDTMAAAQDIDGSFLALTGNADRGAVAGSLPAVNPVGTTCFPISASNRVNVVPDSLRNIVYITTTAGDVLRYDLSACAFLSPYHLGGDLCGAAISPDQNTLVVADLAYSATNNWIDVIDLTTGNSRKISFPLRSYEAGTYSVAFADNNTVLVESQNLYSGGVPLRKVDLTTGTATNIAMFFTNTMLTPAPTTASWPLRRAVRHPRAPADIGPRTAT